MKRYLQRCRQHQKIVNTLDKVFRAGSGCCNDSFRDLGKKGNTGLSFRCNVSKSKVSHEVIVCHSGHNKNSSVRFFYVYFSCSVPCSSVLRDLLHCRVVILPKHDLRVKGAPKALDLWQKPLLGEARRWQARGSSRRATRPGIYVSLWDLGNHMGKFGKPHGSVWNGHWLRLALNGIFRSETCGNRREPASPPAASKANCGRLKS